MVYYHGVEEEIGVWHSLVVRMVRDHEAAGSNPVTPTSGKLPPPIIGGVRRKSLPYHTTAKLGYNGVRSTISSVHNGLQLWALDFFMKDLSSPKILTTPPKSSKKQEKAAKIEPYFKKGLDFLWKYSIFLQKNCTAKPKSTDLL